ncbi:MAG: hypothetical protein ACI8V4_003752, partial [Ilumatobacter sp.]
MVSMTLGVVDRVERVALLREPVLAGGLRSEAVLR